MDTICPVKTAPAYAVLSSAGYVCVSAVAVTAAALLLHRLRCLDRLTVAPQHLIVANSAPVAYVTLP